jgi:NAD(P)-dependent dehydrogenase (short-subunit alcohol dehydrogenase family)
MSKVCVIAGVGPGNGLSLGKRFAQAGHSVALLARSEPKLQTIAKQIPDARTFVCDVSDESSVADAFNAIYEQMGRIDTLIYNAGSGVFGSVEDIDAVSFENSWRVNALGCFLCCKQVIPTMKEGGGNIVIMGATASKRGGAKFAAFASAKAAQFNFAQSIARYLGPQGVHVSYVVIDGVIDIPRTRERFPDRDDSFFLKPDDIAESVFHITQQPPSAWTFELDLRPATESW